MYEIDLLSYVIKRDSVEQTFSLEDYNYENELFMSDYMDYISEEVVTNVSLTIYHNRDVKHLEINLINYSVKRD